MGMRRIATTTGALAAVVALAVIAIVAVAPAGAQDDSSSGGGHTLKIGWAQDPQTLNPFVDQDEEDFRVWAINYDLLVNFSPKDLSPAPGIAKSWTSRRTRRRSPSICSENAKWSDGAADHLQGRQVLARDVRRRTACCSPATPRTSPRSTRRTTYTVVIKTSEPDARIVGGLFVYILPEHIWGKVPVKRAHGLLPADSFRWSAAARSSSPSSTPESS